jgi:AraC-like DNA-binding protein
MARRPRPGIDPALATRAKVSRDGQPLSYNRLAAPDISPWIAWLYATAVETPPDYRLSCSLFNDTAMIRIQLQGDWTAETRDGQLSHGRAALHFGPQSKAMPVSVKGSFTSVGMALKPGVGFAVIGRSAAEFVDRIVPCEEIGLPAEAALGAIDPAASPEDWLLALEGVARAFLNGARAPKPDPLSARFEWLALADPTASIADFAEECGISQRQFERICRRDFGMAPKQVLRRARALDMASHLRGVADAAEAEELQLRYYDQSHMIREFTELFGMAPRQFVATPQPLMTLALESRQSRRLEILSRIDPGQARPWES